jgi:hypothetical protein
MNVLGVTSYRYLIITAIGIIIFNTNGLLTMEVGLCAILDSQ